MKIGIHKSGTGRGCQRFMNFIHKILFFLIDGFPYSKICESYGNGLVSVILGGLQRTLLHHGQEKEGRGVGLVGGW